MEEWKKRLYDHYVTSGQASSSATSQPSTGNRPPPHVRAMIRRHLPPDKDIRIADLACGHGSLVACLRQEGYLHVVGVDVSPEQVALANDLGITGIACGTISDFLDGKDSAFDVIFLMDILEHLTRGELLAVLDRCRSALRSNGLMIAHVPNAEGLFGMRIRYGDLTHESCFTPQSLRQALHTCGFSESRCYEERPTVHGLHSAVRRVLWHLLSAGPRLLLIAETGGTGHILSQNMLVTARRRPD